MKQKLNANAFDDFLCSKVFNSLFFALDKIYGFIQMAVVLAIPIIMMYNGKLGKNRRINTIMKYFFYIYYPLHLFIIGWIQSVR